MRRTPLVPACRCSQRWVGSTRSERGELDLVEFRLEFTLVVFRQSGTWSIFECGHLCYPRKLAAHFVSREKVERWLLCAHCALAQWSESVWAVGLGGQCASHSCWQSPTTSHFRQVHLCHFPPLSGAALPAPRSGVWQRPHPVLSPQPAKRWPVCPGWVCHFGVVAGGGGRGGCGLGWGWAGGWCASGLRGWWRAGAGRWAACRVWWVGPRKWDVMRTGRVSALGCCVTLGE